MAYQPKSYKKFVATAATATMVASAIAPVASANEVSTSALTDVNSRYEAAVEYVLAEGIAIGTSPTTFGVDAQIKRGDAAIMIAKASGLMNDDAPATSFEDVPARGVVAVNSLFEAGVVSGKSATEFGFDSYITRNEAAAMLVKAFGLEGGDVENLPFEDVNSVFDDYVAALVANGITDGVSATEFGAYANIKRGDFAIFLHRISQLSVEDTEAPVLSYEGDTTIYVELGEEIVLPEITVTDNVDEEEEVEVIYVITDENGEEVEEIDVEVDGTYTLTFTATDATGNVSEVLELTVVVGDGVAPVTEVSSVDATTDVIRAEEDQQLGFTVNGGVEASIEELEAAGFTVTFLYDDSISSTDEEAREEGIVNAYEFGHEEEFDYAVVVTDEDGEEVARSEQQTVTVYDASVVEEVTELVLDNDSDLDYVTEAANEGEFLIAVEGLNAFGETLTIEDNHAVFPDVVADAVTSSDISVAYYDEELGLQIVGEGDVTLTAELSNGTTASIDLEVVADATASSILEDGETLRYTTNAEEITFTVIDQYGEPIDVNGTVEVEITDAEGNEVLDSVFEVGAEGDLEVVFPTAEEGEYTYTFYLDEEELGSTVVEFVDLGLADVDGFTLEAEETTVDIYDAVAEAFTSYDERLISVEISALFDDVNITEEDVLEALNELDGEIRVHIGDTDLFEFDVDTDGDGYITIGNAATGDLVEDYELGFALEGSAENAGSTTVELQQVDGDFVTVLADETFTVENSTPQIDDLWLDGDYEELEVYYDYAAEEYVLANPSQLESDDVSEVTGDMIDSVVYSNNDGQALVTVSSVYGGQTFVIAAVEVVAPQ